MAQVSSTNLYHNWGGSEADLRASPSKWSMYMLATIELTSDPHSHTFNLFIELILKREVGIMQTEPQEFNNILYW